MDKIDDRFLRIDRVVEKTGRSLERQSIAWLRLAHSQSKRG